MRAARQRAFVGLGSNLQDPLRQVVDALRELDRSPDTFVVKASGCYRSAPIGPPGQPDYVNAAAEIDTTLDPIGLLRFLQQLEQSHGRVRGERWGARTLDLDLLLYGQTVIQSPTLTVPHPHLHERAFVLMPLQDLAPTLIVPGLGRVSELLASISAEGVERIPCVDDAR